MTVRDATEASAASARPAAEPDEPRSLQGWWAERRLDLSGTTTGERAAVVATLAVAAVAAVLLLWEAPPLQLPGGRVTIAVLDDRGVTLVPTLVLVVACLGIACGSALLALATMRPGWRARTGTQLLLALPAGAIAAELYSTVQLGDGARTAALVALIAVLCVPLGSFLWSLRWPLRGAWVVAVATAAPWLGIAVLLASGLNVFDEYFAASSVALVVTGTLAVVVTAQYGWGVIEGVRGAIATARATIGRFTGTRPGVVLGLALLELGALLVGVFELYPDLLGGGSQAWRAAADDGVLDWLAALAIGAVVIGCVRVVERTADNDRHLGIVMLLLICAWLGGVALATVAQLLFQIAAPFAWLEGVRDVLYDLSDWITDHLVEQRLLVLLMAGPLGVLLIRARPDMRAAGLFLTVFAAWNLPIGLSLLIGGDDVEDPVSPSLVAVVTCVVAVLVIALLVDRRRGVPPTPTELVLLAAFGAIALTEPANAAFDELVSPVGTAAFYLALVLPGVYLFVANARGLRVKPGRAPLALLSTVGSVAIGTSVALLGVSAGTVSPTVSSQVSRDMRLSVVVAAAAALIAAQRTRSGAR